MLRTWKSSREKFFKAHVRKKNVWLVWKTVLFAFLDDGRDPKTTWFTRHLKEENQNFSDKKQQKSSTMVCFSCSMVRKNYFKALYFAPTEKRYSKNVMDTCVLKFHGLFKQKTDLNKRTVTFCSFLESLSLHFS